MPKKKYMYFLQQQTLCHIWLCIGKEREYAIGEKGERSIGNTGEKINGLSDCSFIY